MKKGLLCVFALLLCTGLGCEPEDEAQTGDTAPKITRFFMTPQLMVLGTTETLGGTVDFEDSDGDVSALILRFVNPDGSRTPDTRVPITGTTGLTSGTLNLPAAEITPEVAGMYVLEIELEDAAGQRSNVASDDMEVTGAVVNPCGSLDIDCTGQGQCYNIEPDTCTYLTEHGLDMPECANVDDATQPACVSSLVDPAASDAQCDFVQFWSNPTHLDIDCRCGDNVVNYLVCQRPDSIYQQLELGTGPRLQEMGINAHPSQGVLVGREWMVPMFWADENRSDQGMIFAINLDTGDRRHLSGTHNDPRTGYETIGAGPEFTNVYQLFYQDNTLYAVAGKTGKLDFPMIYTVDLSTGDRELIYDASVDPGEATWTYCDNGNLNPGARTELQMWSASAALDPDGNFYFSGTPATLPGPVIVKLDATTKDCSYVTAVTNGPTGTNSMATIGEGFESQFPYRALMYKDGKIYAVSDTEFVEIDIATGFRTLLSNANGTLGKGPTAAEGMGDFWSTWDPIHEIFLTIGQPGKPLVIAIDPATGDRTSFPCWHPGLGMQGGLCNTTGRFTPGPMNEGAFLIDPDNTDSWYFLHDRMSVVRYDIVTGNTNIISL